MVLIWFERFSFFLISYLVMFKPFASIVSAFLISLDRNSHPIFQNYLTILSSPEALLKNPLLLTEIVLGSFSRFHWFPNPSLCVTCSKTTGIEASAKVKTKTKFYAMVLSKRSITLSKMYFWKVVTLVVEDFIRKRTKCMVWRSYLNNF